MLNKDEIIINKFAQEKIELEEVIFWFENLNSKEQSKTISTAKLCLEQAHPNKEIIEKGVDLIPLKPTATPIVLLKTQGFKIALDKIITLPENENIKSFITLVSLFKLADTERRNIWCKNGCSHEWHNLD